MRMARLLVAAVGMGSVFFVVESAQAQSLDACGDFFFDPAGDVECTLELDPGGCQVKCEPVALEVECAAELYVGCEGGCNADIDVGCDVECQGGCVTECEGGEFDCEAHCNVDCEAGCEAACSSSEKESECHASCQATCSADCGASCDIELPDCETACEASCQGSCHAEANIDCQIECQADGYIDCEAELQGGCEAACEAPEGALFCDGQWVNTDDLQSCADAIIAYFDIEITGYADASCEGNTCTAEAGCAAKCATAAPEDPNYNLGFISLGCAAVGLVAVRRSRRRNKK